MNQPSDPLALLNGLLKDEISIDAGRSEKDIRQSCSLAIKSKRSRIVLLGRARPLLADDPKFGWYLVSDHINLCANNPFIGANSEPLFFSLNGLYDVTFNHAIGSAVVVGLPSPVRPNLREVELLIACGATHYTYDFVRSALIVAHCGLKLLGLVSVAEDGHPA